MKLHLRRRIRSVLGAVPIAGARFHRVRRRRWLLEMLPEGSVGAEIGVWRGDFSAAILSVVKPRVLHLIDPWRSATTAELSGVLYDLPQAQMDVIHEGVVHRFAREIAGGRVVLHRARSVEAASSIADASLDWVYIDGDHTYDGVTADLTGFAPKVRPGGVIAGDDYVTRGRFSAGVKPAVDDFVASGRAELTAQKDGQFVLRIPG